MSLYNNPRLVYSANFPGGLPRILNGGINEIAEASGQSFKSGEFVYNSSGITACADDATSILGIVQEDAVGTGYATHYPEVVILGAGDILEITYTDSTAAVDPTVGTAYGHEVTSNKHYLYIDEVTVKQFRVIKILNTTTKRCLVTLTNDTTASFWQWFAE
jgi:hypothetical protein